MSIRGREIAALASSEPALRKALLPSVVRRFPLAEMGKILRKADKLEVQARIAIFREGHNARPHDPPGLESWRIQIKLADQSSRVAVVGSQ